LKRHRGWKEMFEMACSRYAVPTICLYYSYSNFMEMLNTQNNKNLAKKDKIWNEMQDIPKITKFVRNDMKIFGKYAWINRTLKILSISGDFLKTCVKNQTKNIQSFRLSFKKHFYNYGLWKIKSSYSCKLFAKRYFDWEPVDKAFSSLQSF